MPTFVPLGAACSAGTVTSGSRPSSASVLLLAAKYALIFACVPGMSAFAFGMTSVFVVALERLLDALRRDRQAGVAGLVDDDDDRLRSGVVELLAGALAGDLLVLADVHHVGLEAVERARARS